MRFPISKRRNGFAHTQAGHGPDLGMKPGIFISAVTREFGSTRQRVANIVTRLGYEPVWEDIFGAEPGDLRTILRGKMDSCQGLIQIMGEGYGAAKPDATKGALLSSL